MAQTATGLAAETRELTDENIFQILAQGSLLLMEDDLRQLQGDQAQVFREKRKRNWLKIAPKQKMGAGLPIEKESFFARIKNSLSRSRKQPKALPLSSAPVFVPAPIPVAAPIPAPTPAGPAFSVAAPEPKPTIVKKELASGLRLGERVIDSPEPPNIVAPSAMAPVPVVEKTAPLAAAVLPENFKVEPYSVEELQERIDQKNRFSQEKSDLDAKLQVFWPQRRPLELKIAALTEEKQAIVKALSPFIVKDAQIKSQEKEIEEKEKQAKLPQERHQLEEQRWALEQQRRQAAQQKWAQEEKVEAKNAEIKAAELQLQGILNQESSLSQQKERAAGELEKIALAQERLMLIEKVAALDAQRRVLGKEKATSQSESASAEKQLIELGQQEKAIEAQEASLEETIEKASSLLEKKEIEQNRWRLDEQRKSIEQKRWEIEKGVEQGKGQGNLTLQGYDEALQKQMALEIRAEDIDILLRKPLAEAEGLIAERNRQKPAVEAAKKQEIETRSEQVKPLLPSSTFFEKSVVGKKLDLAAIDKAAIMPGSVKPALNEPEILSNTEAETTTAIKIKRQAIAREREKNLALIQQKAETQRESFTVAKIKGPLSKADILLKLSQVSPEELANRERFMARLAGHAPSLAMGSVKNGKDIVFRPLVKRSSIFEKIVARIYFLLIIFVVAVIAVVLVYFYVILPKTEPSLPVRPVIPVVVPIVPVEPATTTSSSQPATSSPTSTPILPEEPLATTTAPTTTPVVILPQPLLAVQQTKTLQLGATTSIADLLKTALQDNQGAGLTAIFFQTNDNFILSLKGFLEVLQTPWPENIADALETGDTLLISGQGVNSRFGFVAKVKDPAVLAVALKAWEPRMENDWADLWLALGKTKPAAVRYFRGATYDGAAFRYQTFTKQDFGICYAILNDKLILTTSYAQMKLIIDELKKAATP